METPTKMPSMIEDKYGNTWITEGYILDAHFKASTLCNESAAQKILNNALHLASEFVDKKVIKEWLQRANELTK